MLFEFHGYEWSFVDASDIKILVDWWVSCFKKKCVCETRMPPQWPFFLMVTLVFDLDLDRWPCTWYQQKRSCHKVYSCEI